MRQFDTPPSFDAGRLLTEHRLKSLNSIHMFVEPLIHADLPLQR